MELQCVLGPPVSIFPFSFPFHRKWIAPTRRPHA
nr:MAG TPA: hypothetical protein [Caudoviricetes sp.]